MAPPVTGAFLGLLGQWSFYGIFRCPFLVSYISCPNCRVITCHGATFSIFWGFWLLLPVPALLFGRAFCGWACPGDLASQIVSLLAPYRLAAKNIVARLPPYGKYVSLAVAGYFWCIGAQPRMNIPMRVGEFFPVVSLTFEHATALRVERTIFVLVFWLRGFG